MADDVNPSVSRNLQAALAYASRGWHVFPLRPSDKRPLSLRGFHDATTDEAIIHRWWGANPNAGVGIATGQVSNLLVIDVDPRNGGAATLASLEAQVGQLPQTVESMTGGGGRHLFYSAPASGGGTIPGAWPGIDIKGDGGYVCAPYSRHPSGFYYQWQKDRDPDDIPVAAPPQFILDRLAESGTPAREGLRPPQASGDIPEGTRNATLTSLAGTMRRRAMSPEALLAALQIENEARCTPPLPEVEVERIAASVSRYEPGDPAYGGVPLPVGLQFMDAIEALGTEPDPIHWILEGRLARGDVSLLVGPPSTGKSWITLDIALASSAGRPIFGKFKLDDRLRVLIVDEENPPDEVHRRLLALARAWEIRPEDVQGHLFLTQPRQGFSFRNRRMTEQLLRKAEELAPDLIVLDSTTAVSTIKEESSATEVRAFFHDQVYPLQAAAQGAAVLCVHHTSKAIYIRDPTKQVEEAGLARGSIDFLAAPDSVMLLRPTKDGLIQLRTVKVRRGQKAVPLTLEIVNGAAGGVRPLLRSMTTGGDPDASRNQVASTVLDALITSYPEPIDGSTLRAWAEDRTDSGRTDFNNAISMLKDANYIQMVDKKGRTGVWGLAQAPEKLPPLV